MHFDDDADGSEAARPSAEDYRSPDKLHITEGKRDTSDGCHYRRAGSHRVRS